MVHGRTALEMRSDAFPLRLFRSCILRRDERQPEKCYLVFPGRLTEHPR